MPKVKAKGILFYFLLILEKYPPLTGVIELEVTKILES